MLANPDLAPGDSPVLAARGITKAFGAKRALVEADLALDAGQVHGLIGPNGSGKSTLINVMAGVLRPDAGRVCLDGTDITALSPGRRARAGLGRTYQTPQIFETLTLRDHVELAADPGEGQAWGREAASLLGLEPLLDRTVGAFSHGLRRMAEICHVVAARPRLVLLDEPAAGLSEPEMEQLAVLVRWLRERMAVCLVEHNMTFLLGLVDRLTVLDHGEVIATGNTHEVTTHERVRRAYLGDDFTAAAPPRLEGVAG